MKLPFSKISITPYQTMFGSWRNALKAFVEYINGGRVIGDIRNPQTTRPHAPKVAQQEDCE